jgi:hypothetical protein
MRSPADRQARLVLWALAAMGLVLRSWALPLWGTFDTEVQKAWSVRAATSGVADIYGPSDAELIQRGTLAVENRFRWGTATYIVDYPPGSVLVLWAAGKLYALLRPEMPNRPLFNAAINLAPLAASAAIAVLLAQSVPGLLGWQRALLFWLNPAVFLAAPMHGYQDPIFGLIALAAVLALMRGRHVWAAALVVAAGLVKPQGALLLPVLAAVTLRETRPLTWLKAVLAGAGVAASILAPWWSSGHLLSALDGCLRPLRQATLAPLGFNVWWIAGYALEWARSGPWPLAEVVGIQEFRDWAGWDPRIASRALMAASTAAILYLLLRRPRETRWMIPLAVILQVHAYALFGTSVHENHTFLAVVLAPLLVGEWPRASALLAGTSAFLFANLFLTAGFGRRITPLRVVDQIRLLPRLDLSVVAAAGHVILFAALVYWTLTARPLARESPAAA